MNMSILFRNLPFTFPVLTVMLLAAVPGAGCSGTGEPGYVCAPVGNDQVGECVDGVCTNHGCLNLSLGYCTDSYSALPGKAVDWDTLRGICDERYGEWGECPLEYSMLDVRILDGDGAKVRHYYPGQYCSADEARYYMIPEFSEDPDNMPTEICRDDDLVCPGKPVQEEIGCSFTSRGVNGCIAMVGGIHQARKEAFGAYCNGYLGGDVLDGCPDGELASCKYQAPLDTHPASPHYQEFFYRAEELEHARTGCDDGGGDWVPVPGEAG